MEADYENVRRLVEGTATDFTFIEEMSDEWKQNKFKYIKKDGSLKN